MEDSKISQALSQRLIEDSPFLLGDLPLCTIIFELRDTGTNRDPSIGLVMRSDSSSDSPLRIIYDHAVAENSLFVFLKSNLSFRNTDEADVFTSRIPHYGVDSHVVRILPVSGPRKPFPHVPFKIIRRIAEKAFDPQFSDWRASLLSYALVCKSWYPLVDMFYDTLGFSLNEHKLTPRAVSNSLEMQPTKGRLRRLDYLNFKPAPDDTGRMDFSEALISVLRMSVSVKVVLLCVMPTTHIPNLLDTLGQLERVEIFTMYIGEFRYVHSEGMQFPNIVDTQRAIANWTELRTLKLGSWDEHIRTRGTYQMPSRCGLEKLWLKDGNLTVSQLLWFASPYSKIRDLSLIDIRGLSNSGLSAVLHEISSTLGHLVIANCTILREAADEPFALDDAMPKMTCLYTAYIHGDLLTPSSISTKPKILNPIMPSRFSIYCAPNMDDAEGLIKTFETTGWHAIDLAHTDTGAWNDDTQRRAVQTAQEKGIMFKFLVRDM